jgi:hypothetical protein
MRSEAAGNAANGRNGFGFKRSRARPNNYLLLRSLLAQYPLIPTMGSS